MKKKHSPRIINISWGHMEVEGVGTGKDFKLYPGGGLISDRSSRRSSISV